jgi:hypothetical protein
MTLEAETDAAAGVLRAKKRAQRGRKHELVSSRAC